jgi:hypothetical protein
VQLRHNIFVRRAIRLAKQVPRAVRRLGATEQDYVASPPLLANSMPKSGTHLLLQVVSALPGLQGYGSFLASQPVLPYVERSQAQTVRMIGRFAPGEVVGAHMFHHPDHQAALKAMGCTHVFIYRDLRDVAISEAHYLTFMNRFHRMHGYFRRLPTMAERIMAAIKGVPRDVWPHSYPDIGTRFRSYGPWLREPSVCAVRYEEMVGDKREDVVRRIVRSAMRPDDYARTGEAVTAQAIGAIQPEQSHTFRTGRAGGWRNEFTPDHVAAMKAVAGDLLVELGYGD